MSRIAPVPTEFEKKIDAAMRAAGIATRGELASRCQIAESTLSASLKGATADIRLRTLLRLALALQIPVQDLIDGIDPDYDASGSPADTRARVLALWDRAVRKGNAKAVWPVLAMASGVPDEPMPDRPPSPPSRSRKP